MNPEWAAVILGGLVGCGGLLAAVWRGGRLEQILQQLVKNDDDKELRLRALEREHPLRQRSSHR